MGGGGHHHMPKVPDYKIYRVEDVPDLMITKRALAAKGLKDPWLRNEVWKYNNVPSRSSHRVIWRNILGRGMAIGFGLAVVSTIVGKVLEKNDDHGHGHH